MVTRSGAGRAAQAASCSGISATSCRSRAGLGQCQLEGRDQVPLGQFREYVRNWFAQTPSNLGQAGDQPLVDLHQAQLDIRDQDSKGERVKPGLYDHISASVGRDQR